MKIKAYELKSLVEKNKYAAYLIYGQNKGLVREKSQVIIDAYKNDQTEIIKFENDDQRGDFFSIQNTNNCMLKIFDHYDSTKIIIVSLIDNLVKGAAGQAVQNLNNKFNFPEKTGLK